MYTRFVSSLSFRFSCSGVHKLRALSMVESDVLAERREVRMSTALTERRLRTLAVLSEHTVSTKL